MNEGLGIAEVCGARATIKRSLIVVFPRVPNQIYGWNEQEVHDCCTKRCERETVQGVDKPTRISSAIKGVGWGQKDVVRPVRD